MDPPELLGLTATEHLVDRGRHAGADAGSGPSARASRARKALQASALISGALVLVAVLATGWLVLLYPKQTGPGNGETVVVEMPVDGSVGELATRLEQRGLIRHGWLWAAYAGLLGAGDHLRHGVVRVVDDMSRRELLQRLATGYGHAAVSITFPEGYTRFDMAERLERWGICAADAFLDATRDPALLRELDIPAADAEGYLFPDTYELHDGVPPAGIVRRTVRTWRRKVQPVLDRYSGALADLEARHGWGVHEVLTLASIVEKEARAPREQRLIAGVFLNRLEDPDFQPKRLQADPTVGYGCVATPGVAASCAVFDGQHVQPEMLRDPDNPYNTYRRQGLPPGPISNPGVSAIRATLDPATHEYLYFVARGDGSHVFSRTLGAHNQAIDRYQRASSE